MKLEVSAPGDSFEAEADRAADAMVSGAPAVICSGAPQISRQVDGAAPAPANADDKAAMPVFVEFSKDGKWDAQQVLATLQGHATVPQELQAAILEGPRATAIYCVALRDKISATLVDPARRSSASPPRSPRAAPSGSTPPRAARCSTASSPRSPSGAISMATG